MKRILLPVLVIGVFLLGACGQEIPANYTTYTDEAGLFSISYPPEWEPASNSGFKIDVTDIITSIESDLPLESEYPIAIFWAASPSEGEYATFVLITVESIPEIVWTHDSVVEAEIAKNRQNVQDYQEFSRVETTVDGIKATIVEWEGAYEVGGRLQDLEMFVLVGKTVWSVTCMSPPGEFSKLEEDFQIIVRSLRILK